MDFLDPLGFSQESRSSANPLSICQSHLVARKWMYVLHFTPLDEVERHEYTLHLVADDI